MPPSVYPVLQAAVEHCSDDRWANVLAQASRGCLPPQFEFKGGSRNTRIVHKRNLGTKATTLEVPQDPAQASRVVPEFLLRCDPSLAVVDESQPAPRRPDPIAPLYQVLMDAKQHTQDPYWVALLERAGHGILPPNFYFRAMSDRLSIMHRKKTGGKTQTLDVSRDPARACKEVHDFMRDREGLMSDAERSHLVETAKLKQVELRPYRDQMLEAFVYSTLTRRYNLDPAEQLFLICYLSHAFSAKIMQSKDIIVEPGTARIVSIDGLDEDHFLQTRTWRTNTALQTNKTAKASLRSDTRMA